MKRYLAGVLAALVASLGGSIVSAPPAPAGPPGAIIKHMSNDPGMFSPFIAECNKGGTGGYPVDITNPGSSTNNTTPSGGGACVYATGVNVFQGEQLWCRPYQSGGATQLYWTIGYHPWIYSSSIECEVKAA